MTQWGLDTLFNPAKRHMDEEKRRLQSTREEVGDSSGGKRIDLESGKVTIKRAGKDADGAADAASASSAAGTDAADTDQVEAAVAGPVEEAASGADAAQSDAPPSATP